MQIKNVIFDLGGVLLNIDYNRTKDAFAALGFLKFEDMYNQYHSDGLFTRLETGQVTPDEFYQHMLAHAPHGVTANDIHMAWNAMLLNFRKPTLAFITELRKTRNVYLLSNTNAIHKAAFLEIISAETGVKDFDGCFTKAWYSHKIGMRKPDVATYQYVLKDAGIKAEETMFIDDSYNNVEGALAAGIRTHLLLLNEQIQDLNYD